MAKVEQLVRVHLEIVNTLPWNVTAKPFPPERKEVRSWEEDYAQYPAYTRYIRIGGLDSRQRDRSSAERFEAFVNLRKLISELVDLGNLCRGEGGDPGAVTLQVTTNAFIAEDYTLAFHAGGLPYWYQGLDLRRFRQCERLKCRRYFWAKPLDKEYCRESCQKAAAAQRSRERETVRALEREE